MMQPLPTDAQLAFRDFAPQAAGSGGFLNLQTTYQPLQELVRLANEWIAASKVHVINVETIVVPNLDEETSGVPSSSVTYDERMTEWFQVVRVWYFITPPPVAAAPSPSANPPY